MKKNFRTEVAGKRQRLEQQRMFDHGTVHTEGYRRAADILNGHIDESGRNQDFLDYPVLFLCRHHLELLIKQVIFLALMLAEDADNYQYKNDNHNLNTLLPLAQKLILVVDDSFRPSDFKIIKEVVKALHQVDKRATGFRYARRNDGSFSLEGINYINTRCFSEQMEAASDFLDGVDNGLLYLLDSKA